MTISLAALLLYSFVLVCFGTGLGIVLCRLAIWYRNECFLSEVRERVPPMQPDFSRGDGAAMRAYRLRVVAR